MQYWILPLRVGAGTVTVQVNHWGYLPRYGSTAMTMSPVSSRRSRILGCGVGAFMRVSSIVGMGSVETQCRQDAGLRLRNFHLLHIDSWPALLEVLHEFVGGSGNVGQVGLPAEAVR